MESIKTYLEKSTVFDSKVQAWEETLSLETYETGTPEKNPLFLEKRIYQGSSGVVYPYPVIESVSDEKQAKPYRVVFLENEYIKLMMMPELGGRLQMAFDKLKKRHFIYFNQVIKPALVGLTGPWISGGIEFNWPQHHRPSTFLPVDFTIEEFPDGSITVWMNENEKMFHQKGQCGFTLYPGKAYVEIKGKVSNPTPVPQTFLWWANPAVAVNDQYQSVFPPDVHAVFDHGKRDVSTFPVATGTYYKVDYSAGVDISNYKNIPVPTSYMAINSAYDFLGGYENDTRAGVLHVANHHISPGKKQWTWGKGDFGKAWERHLTDNDGPYIELMAGVYTDNQPDFSWLQPYEEKSFNQYFLPYRELGVVKNASKDLMLNYERKENKVIVKALATSLLKAVCVEVKVYEACSTTVSSQKTDFQFNTNSPSLPCQSFRKDVLFFEIVDLSPEQVYIREITLNVSEHIEIQCVVCSSDGKELLSIRPIAIQQTVPEAAKAPLSPKEIATTEELYLIGLHLEQFRHATFQPTHYYEEALQREPSDVRNNTAMGLWLLRRGQFAKAEAHFRRAIATLTQRNPNPYEGDSLYYLGLSLQFQYKLTDAYAAFYKACWNGSWQDAGYLACARISATRGNLSEAMSEVEKSLVRNGHNHQSRALKAALLRKMGYKKEALEWIQSSLRIDSFNFACLFERYFLTQQYHDLQRIHTLMRHEIHNYEITALDYIAAGMYSDAVQVLQTGIEVAQTSPMTYYYMGWAQCMNGEKDAEQSFQKAAQHTPDYCFPNRLEAILALQCALTLHSNDARALYYLGNLWYDKRQYAEAVHCWEQAVELDPHFPTAWRNASHAYFNHCNQPQRAETVLQKAFDLNTAEARLLMELDQLYKRRGRSPFERLKNLEQYFHLVLQRDDMYVEFATLLNQTEQYERAITHIDNRNFHPWEGGEGKVSTQYKRCRIESAKKAINSNDYERALHLLKQCLSYPPHLGEGKLHGTHDQEIHFWLGCTYEKNGMHELAHSHWELATTGNLEPMQAIFYNDPQPANIFYQGLACLKLGKTTDAQERFNALIRFGEKHMNQVVSMDYFAVSLPDLLVWEDDLQARHNIHCWYLMGMGYIGNGQIDQGREALLQALKLDNYHTDCQLLLQQAEWMMN